MNQKDQKIGQTPQPIRGNEGASILGPRNPSREAENLDKLMPPKTDAGTLPQLKMVFRR